MIDTHTITLEPFDRDLSVVTIDDLILAEERCQEVIARMTETMAYIREAINAQAWIINAESSDTYDAMNLRDRALNAAIDRCINDTPAIKRIADILNDAYYRAHKD